MMLAEPEHIESHAVGKLDLPVSAYIDIAIKKTASLFAASAECGALMAESSALRVKALRDFGLYYGIAFQMLDDLLDVTASESEIGKPVGNDLLERKMTLPLIFALEEGNRDFAQAVGRFYAAGDGRAGRSTIPRLIAGIAEAGGLAKTGDAILGYVERAKMSLAPLGSAPARAELGALADALARDSATRTR